MARIMYLKDKDMALQVGTTRTVKGFENGKKTITGEFTTTIQTGWRRSDQKGKNVAPIIELVRVLRNYSEETINILQAGPPLRERIPSRFDHGNQRVAYFLRKQKFFLGMGLGRYQQGRTQPVESKTVLLEGTYSLGYHPTEEEISRDQIKKRRKAQVKNRGEPYVPPAIDWSRQLRYPEWFVKKGHHTAKPPL
ncbi:hypothetical protein BVC80_7145g2 [Macleaya cordata]|uniref:Uncharacterized protein n=1 Tax=Macleaya cordata TaxID=56857 RepID=A0A200QFR5_MACCD|nr:hypothetical protein BVC80_7145g2 [Macleaya cordata]